ncbi:MAG: LysM peptidoglycan-binding domain-containing protein [Alphaproteobacteria bacterium]
MLTVAAVVLGAINAVAQDAADPPPGFIPTTFEVHGLSDGLTIVAGVAEPNAIVELLEGANIVSRAEANEFGEWIAAPEGLAPGVHELLIRTTSPDGRFQMVSKERVVVTVPGEPVSLPLRPESPESVIGFGIGDFDIAITVAMGTGTEVDGTISNPLIVTVRNGDTLWDIAQQIYGDGSLYQLIVDANRGAFSSVRALQPGQTLLIPPAPGG